MYRDTSDTDFLRSMREILAAEPRATQREIARRTGVSLGLVNAWLSRLEGRGWLAAAPAGGRRVRYSVTAAGAAELAAEGAERMREAFAQMGRCAESVGGYLREAKVRGVERVVLYGGSGIGFLIEYACARNGLAFEARCGAPGADARGRELRVMGEEVPDATAAGCLSVFDLAAEGKK